MSSNTVLGEVVADQIWRNRHAGWLTHALEVLESGPYLRRMLLKELIGHVVKALGDSLPEYKVSKREYDRDGWFSMDVGHLDWGDYRIGLANWKYDASEMGIGVYNPGWRGRSADEISRAAPAGMVASIKKAMKPGVWVGTKIGPEFVSNVSTSPSDWSTPSFLLRVADRPQEAVDDVQQQVMKVLGQVDALLRIPAATWAANFDTGPDSERS